MKKMKNITRVKLVSSDHPKTVDEIHERFRAINSNIDKLVEVFGLEKDL